MSEEPQRHEESVHPRWDARRDFRRRHRPPTLFGLVLIGLGVLFLLDNFHVLAARELIRNYWPALIILWGGARLVSGRDGDRFAGGVAVLVGAVLLGNRLLGWNIRAWALFWPLILIAVGINVLFRSCRYPGRPIGGAGRPTDGGPGAGVPGSPVDGPVESATLKEFAVMSHLQHNNVSQAFRGGEITAVMGGVELDLRECRLATDTAHLNVFVAMGGVELRIPRDWVVESGVSLFMAGLDNRSLPPVEPSPKRLVIDGSAFMGGIEIKN